jgi:hypothetical protein
MHEILTQIASVDSPVAHFQQQIHAQSNANPNMNQQWQVSHSVDMVPTAMNPIHNGVMSPPSRAGNERKGISSLRSQSRPDRGSFSL